MTAALIILEGNFGYMTVRDWRDSDGQSYPNTGIIPFTAAMDSAGAQEAFRRVVKNRTGTELDDLTGYDALVDDGANQAPVRPGVCVFRVSSGDDLLVARDLQLRFNLPSPQSGAFVVDDSATDLLEAFHTGIPDDYPDTPAAVMNPDLLDAAGLSEVHMARTITKSILESDQEGNSADFGDSADYGDAGA